MNEKHKHWEINTTCPKCNTTQHLKIPVGETILAVNCNAHGCRHNYTHIVVHPDTVED
jgi:Zn ribbon nucleic-acid-binding protein